MGEDVRATIAAFRAMGVSIDETAEGHLSIDGRGFDALSAPAGPLDLGNSGTSIRLLAGLLAGCGFELEMTGDESLCRRPMKRVTEPLGLMGARVATADGGTPPLRIMPVGGLHGIHYALPVASAQVKSAVLLAGLRAEGSTCVRESVPSRDHTEHMLRAFAIPVNVESGEICIDGPCELRATDIVVPGDISSAAFFLVGAAMCEGAELTITNVGVNPTRTGVIDILRGMGADIDLANQRLAGSEAVADITVRGSTLHGIDIPAALVPSAIDEFPALFVAAACAGGVTRLAQASELRHKESDRIDAMATGLRALGVEVNTRDDGIEIQGRPGGLDGGCVQGRGDHRIAMAFAMAALKARGAIEIQDSAAIATSFPDFVPLARRAGLQISDA